MDTQEVGRKLVELCRQGKNLEAIDTLLAGEVVSEEAIESPAGPRVVNGIDAVRKKNTWWVESHEIHKHEVTGPFPNGDQFAVTFAYEVTAKTGPMAGKRMKMDEVAVYTVKNGKIVHEKFFYSMG
jgi:ketosteroid isomerase-like protein